jgi:hypothetical protein
MVMSPVGLGTKNDCAGEGQQQFTGLVWIASDSQLPLWVSCELAAIQREREHGSRGMPTVASRYQAMTGEDIEEFVYAAVQWSA